MLTAYDRSEAQAQLKELWHGLIFMGTMSMLPARNTWKGNRELCFRLIRIARHDRFDMEHGSKVQGA
jgi:hypothetical protein